jgi:hypothetical protein
MSPELVVMIPSHGRPDKVITIHNLRRAGYTGRIFIVLDDQDKTQDRYKEIYGDQVIIFNFNKEIERGYDTGDNFKHLRTTTYVRNALPELARGLGIKYYIMLDDDYTNFGFKYNSRCEFITSRTVTDLDSVFRIMLEFFISSKISCLAMAQGGDFIGGQLGLFGQGIRPFRKIMNSFICSTDREFQFLGRLNEDVNTYVRLGNTGHIFMTINQLSLNQKETQQNSGGMSETYISAGTYVKSFYSVMYHPSGVKISVIRGPAHTRIHHRISWNHTAPKIVSESLRKV